MLHFRKPTQNGYGLGYNHERLHLSIGAVPPCQIQYASESLLLLNGVKKKGV